MDKTDNKNKESRRVIMTKRLLKDSLIEMMHNKSIHAISIRDLCALADVNRSTFYNHYGSQYDLLYDIEEDFFCDIGMHINNSEINDEVVNLISLLNYLLDNRELCNMLLFANVDPDFPDKLIFLPIIHQSVTNNISSSDTHKTRYIYRFVVNGAYESIKFWLNSDNPEPVEKMAEILLEIIHKLID